MKKIVYGILLSFFIVGNCYGFETGKWVGSDPSGGLDGSIEIKKSGKINIGVGEQQTINFRCGCDINDGKIIEKGNRLEVYKDGKLGFTVVQNNKDIQVLIHLSIDDPMCICGGGFEFNLKNRKDIDEYEKTVSKMKWKKVKKFPWE